MGSEWAEEQAGPQGPPGAAGGSFLASSVVLLPPGGGNAYSGTAEGAVLGASVAGALTAFTRYRVTVQVPVQTNNAGDVALLRVRTGSVLGALVGTYRLYLPRGGEPYHASFAAVLEPAADAVTTLVLTCARSSGAGTITVPVGAGDPALVELQTVAASVYNSA